MSYLALKHAHLLFVVVSLLLFAGRWLTGLLGGNWRRRRWLRILPHVNDTLLLSAAVAMVLQIHRYPFVNSSVLTAKVLALLLYIILGHKALARGRSLAGLGWGAAALACFGYIAGVAVTKQILPWA